MAGIFLQHATRVHSVSTRRAPRPYGAEDAFARHAEHYRGRFVVRIGSPATRLADLGPQGTDNGSFKDGWSFSGSRGFLQVLELNGHGSIGFQEFQELKVHPFQAVFGGQQSENDDDPDNFAVQLERHTGGQILLAR